MRVERKIEEPGFWDAPEESQKIMKELKDLQEHLKVIHALYSEYDDICTLIEMVDEEEDRSMVKDIPFPKKIIFRYGFQAPSGA